MTALRMSRRDDVRLVPDPRRVISKPFVPRDEAQPDGSTRLRTTLDRILAIPEREVAEILVGVRASFDSRHRDLEAVLELNARHVDHLIERSGSATSVSSDRRRLIGAYFTHEYSIEAAALGNPSLVAAPDQSGTADGQVRFVMSLRAIGEGHISSIEFRTGTIGADAEVVVDPPSPFAVTGERVPHAYDKAFFLAKLDDLALLNHVEERVLARLGARFTMAELEASISALEADGIERSISGQTARVLHWLASSNYRVTFPPAVEISERVMFPSGPTESRGMEDARFVRFVDDDGVVTYYATYTAFDGHQILPQLIETSDFAAFRVMTLSGRAARNKGMAIFPRRIGGRYAALCRHDGVNNHVMFSEDVRVWADSAVIQEPARPWELMQLGNCGSPIETEAGWLVITHGVGPLRQYALGALLLDLHDPSRVIGHLREPLLVPDEGEREGYVPNVVYSCGSMVHAGHLVLPYGYADVGASVATLPLADLLSAMTGSAR